MMRKLKDKFFEENDDSMFVEEDRGWGCDYDGHSDYNDEINELRGSLCFYSFVLIAATMFIGGIYLISRIIMYPFIKKIAEDWD